MIAHDEIASSGHACRNLKDRPSTDVAVAEVVGVHPRVGIRGDRHVPRNACPERIVERSHSCDNRSIIIVSDPLPLPSVPGMEGAIAGKELIAIRSLDHAHLRVRPGEAEATGILQCADRWLGTFARIFYLIMCVDNDRRSHGRLAK
jgi:hypothetical protein